MAICSQSSRQRSLFSFCILLHPHLLNGIATKTNFFIAQLIIGTMFNISNVRRHAQ